jgi:DNA-binding protein YbaB
MGFFDKAKDLYTLKKQASEIEKRLKQVTIEAESNGITVICDGKQLFTEAKGNEQAPLDPKLAKTYIDCVNKAIKKSQQIGADRMKDVMGGLMGGDNKDLYTLQKKAKAIKEQLKNIHIEAEVNGLFVTCDGEQYFIEAHGSDKTPLDPTLAKTFIDATNKAIHKSQMIGAEKMQEVMGPGMGGLLGK